MKGSRSVWARRAGLLAACGVFFVANLAFYFAYGSTTRTREAALENRRAALEQEVSSAEAEAARLSGQRERLARVSSAIEEFYGRRVGPRRETLAPVVNEIHDVFRRAGVSPTQISYTTAPVADLPLSQMLIAFGFRGDYATFKRLLRLFETNRRWLIVRETALSRDGEVPGSVEVRMVVATYFSGAEESVGEGRREFGGPSGPPLKVRPSRGRPQGPPLRQPRRAGS